MMRATALLRLLRFVSLLSLRQSLRRARRSLASFVGVIGGLVLAFAQIGIQDALYDGAIRLHKTLNGEVIIVPAEFDMLLNPVWLERNALSTIAGQPAIADITYLYTAAPAIRGISGNKVQQLLVLGLDPYAPAIDTRRIGADLSKILIPGHALWDSRSQPHWGDINGALKRHGSVDLQTAMANLGLQTPITIVGTYALGGSITVLGSMIVSQDTFRDFGGQSAERPNMAVIKLRPGVTSEAVAAEFNQLLPGHVRAVSTAALIAEERRFWSEETPIGYFLDLSAAIGIFICAVFVGQALVQTIDENLSEYAVLRTLDVPDGAMLLAIVLTGLFLVLAASPFAAGVAMVIYHFAAAATDLPFDMTLKRSADIVGISLLTALFAGLLTGRRLVTADPARLL